MQVAKQSHCGPILVQSHGYDTELVAIFSKINTESYYRFLLETKRFTTIEDSLGFSAHDVMESFI